jgi:hypothetical protein
MHGPLRRIYRKVSFDFPAAPPEMILKCATKALNDTMGENGLVPSLLIFGIIPRFPILATDLPEQRERMRILAAAQVEYNTVVAERRILEALKSRVSDSADRVYEIGEEVLVWRERPESWTGPYKITSIQENIVTIYHSNSEYEGRYNVANVKPYLREFPSTNANSDFSEIMHQVLQKFISGDGESQSPSYNIHVTEVICNGDPRERLFDNAKKKKIAGLIRRGTWKVVWKEELEQDANIMSGRFVVSIKHSGTNEEMLKARFVAQGYRDKAKTS